MGIGNTLNILVMVKNEASNLNQFDSLGIHPASNFVMMSRPGRF
jgi:hypothetical protein